MQTDDVRDPAALAACLKAALFGSCEIHHARGYALGERRRMRHEHDPDAAGLRLGHEKSPDLGLGDGVEHR